MGIGLAIAGIALSAVGTMKSVSDQKEAGQTAGAISDVNATIATENAGLARMDAKAEETRIRKDAEALKGRQRAAYASSGVDIGTGSPLLVLVDTARQAEIEALTVRNRGEIEAVGYEREAVGQKFSGQQQRKAGESGATSTILSGAGRILSSYRS